MSASGDSNNENNVDDKTSSSTAVEYKPNVLFENQRAEKTIEDDSPFLQKHPMELFDKWYQEAKEGGKNIYPATACLSTCSTDGKPSSRMITIKHYGIDEGFVFCTDTTSRKAVEMAQNPHVSLVFWWTDCSVRIEGTCQLEHDEEQRQAYFARGAPRSQIAAWVCSEQSAPIASRQALEEKHAQVLQRFGIDNAKSGNTKIPVPSNFGVYRMESSYFEFWQGRSTRLHDRFAFKLSDNENEWFTQRLQS